MSAAQQVAALVRDPHDFLAACRKARDKGFKGLDAYCPYPVHGFDEALGLKRSFIGRPVLAMLILGAVAGFMLQWFTMKADWPINLGGKPFNSWPQFVVITFEMGILAGALVNMGLAFFTADLGPRLRTELFRDDLTDDTFALIVAPSDENGSLAEIRAFFDGIDEIEETEIVSEQDPEPAEAEAGDA